MKPVGVGPQIFQGGEHLALDLRQGDKEGFRVEGMNCGGQGRFGRKSVQVVGWVQGTTTAGTRQLWAEELQVKL